MDRIDPMTILRMLLAIGALSAVGGFALTLVQQDRTAARLKVMVDRRRELALQAVEALRGPARALPKRREWTMVRALVERLRLLQKGSLATLKRELAAEGWRDPATPSLFIAAILGLPVVFGGIGLFWSAAPALASRPMFQTLVPVGLAALGVMLPRLLLTNAAAKRRAAISRAFPDALDLVVICVEAGLSTEAAFNRVTEEMVGQAPAIGEEFGLLSAELAFLPDRRKPLENLAERTGLSGMRSLSTTLLQSEKYGTPVAMGLRVLSQENRETRMSAAEKKAASLPAKLTVPMIVFFLPVLFAIIAGPAAIRLAAS